jgi:hypothetical protein
VSPEASSIPHFSACSYASHTAGISSLSQPGSWQSNLRVEGKNTIKWQKFPLNLKTACVPVWEKLFNSEI